MLTQYDRAANILNNDRCGGMSLDEFTLALNAFLKQYVEGYDLNVNMSTLPQGFLLNISVKGDAFKSASKVSTKLY